MHPETKLLGDNVEALLVVSLPSGFVQLKLLCGSGMAQS